MNITERNDGTCDRCNESAEYFGPDPYNHEINDDDTPGWLCEDCLQESMEDI